MLCQMHHLWHIQHAATSPHTHASPLGQHPSCAMPQLCCTPTLLHMPLHTHTRTSPPPHLPPPHIPDLYRHTPVPADAFAAAAMPAPVGAIENWGDAPAVGYGGEESAAAMEGGFPAATGFEAAEAPAVGYAAPEQFGAAF